VGRQRRDVQELVITAVAFGATLAALFAWRPLSRPSQMDRFAFELGYYVGACLDATLASDEVLLSAEIRRLSAALGVTAGLPAGAQCPDETWIPKPRQTLSSQLDGSLSMGQVAALLERSRLVKLGTSAEQEAGSLLHRLAEQSHPGGPAAVKPFLAGEIDATGLHRRLFHPPEPLRYQLNINAGRHAFALGYHLHACHAADARAMPAMRSEIVRLADTLRLPRELLPRESAPIHEPVCPASEVSSEHFGAWVGGLFLLGQTVALHEDLRRANERAALDRLKPSMLGVAYKLDPRQILPLVAQFSQGRVSAAQLHQRLFGDTEPLLSGAAPRGRRTAHE